MTQATAASDRLDPAALKARLIEFEQELRSADLAESAVQSYVGPEPPVRSLVTGRHSAA